MNVVNLGDCIKGMRSLGDASVDHIITDPPYSEHVQKNMRSLFVGRTDGKKYEYSTTPEFSHLSPDAMRVLVDEASRVVRRWAIFFTAVEMVGEWISVISESEGLDYIRTGLWLKPNPVPQFTGDRPGTGYEAMIIAHGSAKMRWNGSGRPAIWSVPVDKGFVGDAREHPTQKPIVLMEALIRDFTDKDELVCDPFLGSGTTGVACKRLGRRFIGWESQEQYAAIARRRINETREQLSLLDESA